MREWDLKREGDRAKVYAKVEQKRETGTLGIGHLFVGGEGESGVQ